MLSAAVWLMLSSLLYSLQLSSGSFPRPLTREEEQYYLDLLSHPEWLETEAYEETVAETAVEETLSEAA